jgi:hypothetical protein
MRPLSVCIDTQSLKNNLNIVKKFSPNSKIMAVLKANAYGHGLIECARNLNPIDGIAVLNLSEAIDLREHGFEHKILLLEGFFDKSEIGIASRMGIDSVVHCHEQIEMINQAKLKKPLNLHLKFNTGMNRLGFPVHDSANLINSLIQARQLLKSRASTIFNAPVIDALYEKNYESASRLNFEKTQKKISKQSWYLFNKIKQIQIVKREHVGFSFYEVHPELSFMAMNDMRVIVEPKKTPEGQAMRRTMIKSFFPSFNFDLVRQKFKRTDVADDDILDAMAVLWSTQRIVDKMAEFVPKKSSFFEPRIYY